MGEDGGSSYVGGRTNPIRRSIWSKFTRLLTVYAPNFVMMRFKRRDQIQSWREKVALCTILILTSIGLMFLLEGLPHYLCRDQHRQDPYTLDKVESDGLNVIHGKVVDFSTSNTELGEFIKSYPGKDLSLIFPRYSLLARFPKSRTYPSAPINECIPDPTTADAWLAATLASTPGYKVDQFRLVGCPDPNSPDTKNSVPCYSAVKQIDQVRDHTLDDLIHLPDENDKDIIYLDGTAYNLKSFLQPQLDQQDQLISNNLLFPLEITELIRKSKDSTKAQELIQHPDWIKYRRCMDLLFYKGKVKSKSSNFDRNDCSYWSIPLIFCMIPLSIILLKYLLSLLSFKRSSTTGGGYSPCIIMIPCFNETKEEIESCISSAVETNYIDHGKLLMVICDGTICLESALVVLGHQGVYPDPKSYQSVGVGTKASNFARVFSGYYYHGSHGVPYIVVVKIGNQYEPELPGNRGKRDSLLIILNFLDGISSSENLLTPLEVELYKCIQNLDLDPNSFNYLFCVNADTKVDPNSLPLLLHHLDSHPDCMAVSGQVNYTPSGHWLIDPLQSFRTLFYGHHTMNGLSTINALTYLNGGFIVYRLQQSTGTRCLTHEELVFRLANKRINTLHTKHIALLGEEEFVTLLLLQFWPSFRLSYVPGAKASTLGVASLWQLILRERSKFNIRFHSLIELWSTSALWGLRMLTLIWATLGIIWCFIMPIFTGYLYAQLIFSFQSQIFPYFLLPIWIGILIVLSLGSILLDFQLESLLGLFSYLILGIPLYHILIPLYSFLTMDDFQWYDLGGDEVRARQHGALESSSRQHAASALFHPIRPSEKSHIGPPNHPGFLPVPGGFKSLYTELNQMGVPINMPQDQSFSYSPQHLAQPLNSIPQLPPVAIDRHLDMSYNSPTPDAMSHLQNQKLSDLSTQLSGDPNRISSWQASLLRQLPDANISPPSQVMALTRDRIPSSMVVPFVTPQPPPPRPIPNLTSPPSHSNRLDSIGSSLPHSDHATARTSSHFTSHPTSPTTTSSHHSPTTRTSHRTSTLSIHQSQSLIRDAIYDFLHDADLHAVTRREVKEHLLATFGPNVVYYQDFILRTIEEITLQLPNPDSP